MTSAALRTLEQGMAEIDHLLEADPAPRGGLSPKPRVTRVIIRSAVVLLASHFERYIRAVTEEAVAAVNRSTPSQQDLTLALRLEHSRVGIADIADRSWEKREKALADFVETDAWLWEDSQRGELQANRLLTWLKSPKPEKLMRVYRLWGIENIFKRITRTYHTRRHFFLRLSSLVEKRNDIAHGDASVEATRDDIRAYQKSVRDFCRRADAVLAQALKTKLGISGDWHEPI